MRSHTTAAHVCAVAIALAGLVTPANADVITLTPVKDNTLYETADGSTSNGAGDAMFAGNNSQSSHRRALVAFDVAGNVPAGATIDAATLTLYNDANNASSEPVGMHRLLADWGEAGSVAPGNGGNGGPAEPGDATWLHRSFDDVLWDAPGGDFTDVLTSTVDVVDPGFYTWPSTDQFVGDVQSFLDDPAGNFGWILIGNELAPSSAKRFGTREVADADHHPALEITYTPIPEPGTLLLLLAGVAIVGTRR